MADRIRYGYARVSKAEPDELNLENQVLQLKSAGVRLEHIEAEIISGKTTDRSKWKLIMDRAEAGDTILVTDIDRISRNLLEGLQDIQELRDRGVGVKCLNTPIDTSDDNPAGDVVLHVLMAISEFQRNQARQKIMKGLETAKKAGRKGGRPKYPLGTEQADLILEMLERGQSISAIARGFGVSRTVIYSVRDAHKGKN